MFGILKTIGLENHSVEAVGSEFEQDMAALESFVDLEASLNVSALESAMESIGYTQLAIAEAAGAEGILEALGFVGTEAVVDVASRQWYKLKTVIKSLFNTVINFFKKMLSLGNVTDKAMKAVKKKAEAYDKRWGKEAGYVKLENDKEVDSHIGNISDALAITALINKTKGAVIHTHNVANGKGKNKTNKQVDVTIDDYLTYLETLSKKTDIKSVINYFASNKLTLKAVDAAIDMYTSADKVDLREKFLEIIAEAEESSTEKESMSLVEFKTGCKNAISNIKDTADLLITMNLSKKIASTTKVFEKLKKDIDKIKDDEKDAIFGKNIGQAEWEKYTHRLSTIISILTAIPTAYSVVLKSVIRISNKGFTEVERCLSMR